VVPEEPESGEEAPVVEAAQYISELFDLTSAAPTTLSLTVAQYEAVWYDVVAAYESVSDEIGNNFSPRGAFVGCLLRTEGHDFMDYRITNGTMTGGSDGCINLNEADNLGLPSCIAEFGIEPIYAMHSSYLSLADFFVIMAEAAMSRSATHYNANNPFAEGTLA